MNCPYQQPLPAPPTSTPPAPSAPTTKLEGSYPFNRIDRRWWICGSNFIIHFLLRRILSPQGKACARFLGAAYALITRVRHVFSPVGATHTHCFKVSRRPEPPGSCDLVVQIPSFIFHHVACWGADYLRRSTCPRFLGAACTYNPCARIDFF